MLSSCKAWQAKAKQKPSKCIVMLLNFKSCLRIWWGPCQVTGRHAASEPFVERTVTTRRGANSRTNQQRDRWSSQLLPGQRQIVKIWKVRRHQDESRCKTQQRNDLKSLTGTLRAAELSECCISCGKARFWGGELTLTPLRGLFLSPTQFPTRDTVRARWTLQTRVCTTEESLNYASQSFSLMRYF